MQADHAESDWNSRDRISAESGLCYRQDTVIRFLLPPAAETAALFTHCGRSEINQNVSGVWLIPQFKTPFPHVSASCFGHERSLELQDCETSLEKKKKSNGWNKTYCKEGMLFMSRVSNSLYRQCYHLFGHVPSVILYLNFLLSDIVHAELALHHASVWWRLSSWMEIYALDPGLSDEIQQRSAFLCCAYGF